MYATGTPTDLTWDRPYRLEYLIPVGVPERLRLRPPNCPLTWTFPLAFDSDFACACAGTCGHVGGPPPPAAPKSRFASEPDVPLRNGWSRHCMQIVSGCSRRYASERLRIKCQSLRDRGALVWRCNDATVPLLRRINAYLMRWLRKKYKRLASAKKSKTCWERVTAQYPRSLPTRHGCPVPSGQGDRSRVTGDCYARICGGPGLRCPGLPDLRTLVPILENRLASIVQR